jgi:hypothetical protein
LDKLQAVKNRFAVKDFFLILNKKTETGLRIYRIGINTNRFGVGVVSL